MEIAVRHRPGPPARLRCAYCHDGIAAAEPCDGCGAVFHSECGSIGGRCPTLGCERIAPFELRALFSRMRLALRRRGPFDLFDVVSDLFCEACAWSLAVMGLVTVCAGFLERSVRSSHVPGLLAAGTFMAVIGLGGAWGMTVGSRPRVRRMAWGACAAGVVALVASSCWLAVGLAEPGLAGLAVGASLASGGAGLLRLTSARRSRPPRARSATSISPPRT